MSGIDPYVLFNVNQIKTEFRDSGGNLRTGTGTGFWVSHKERAHFVTNKHNLDPALAIGNPSFRLNAISIRLRKVTANAVTSLSEYFLLSEAIITAHRDADVAIISEAKTRDFKEGYVPGCFPFHYLANQATLEKLDPMDMASFIGFPGSKGIPWYDDQWNLAIARSVNIASFPRQGFSNKNIPTADTMLVSGLSFSGSSGSPVLNHLKGGMSGFTGPGYTSPHIIGIMSGHWHENSSEDVFKHSGLSYLTRSTSILDLFECIGQNASSMNWSIEIA